MKEESLLLLSDLQKLINQVVLIDYTIIILGGVLMTEVKIALSIEEAADYTGIGRNTLRKLVEWKKLPVLKVGRKVLIKTDMLEKFMTANEGRDLRDKGNVRAVTRNVTN